MKYKPSIKFFFIFFTASSTACSNGNAPKQNVTDKATEYLIGSFGYDAAFLKRNLSHMIELSDANGEAKVILTADYQGRVMTSTSNSDSGNSYGRINFNLVKTKKFNKQFNLGVAKNIFS